MNLSALILALAAATTAPAVPAGKDVPIPEKLPPPPGEDLGPTVTIRTMENGDVVQEYRTGGRLTMVRVQPQRGKAYYLYFDAQGRLDRSDAERNAGVAPVYWVIYAWH